MSSELLIEWNRAQVWESAFKIAEAPMSFFNKLQNTYGNHGGCFLEFFDTMPTLYSEHRDHLIDGLYDRNLIVIKYSLIGLGNDVKQTFIHLYDKKHLVLIILGTGIAYPLSLMMVPVSIIADIFAGVIQASLRACQGADKEEVLSILHKKVIASPVQQGVYLLTGILVLGIIGGGMAIKMQQAGSTFITAFAVSSICMSALMGNLLYYRCQQAVAELPRFYRPDGFNVFIEGGAQNEFGVKVNFDPESTYQKWRHEQQQRAKDYAQSENDIISSIEFAKIKQRIQEDLDKLDKKFPEKFIEIRKWFEKGEESYKLFGFPKRTVVSEEELKKRYKLLAFKCHPDRFQSDERKEAEIWFKLLMEARLDVEKNFLQRNAQ